VVRRGVAFLLSVLFVVRLPFRVEDGVSVTRPALPAGRLGLEPTAAHTPGGFINCPAERPHYFLEPALPPSPRSIQATARGCDPIESLFLQRIENPRAETAAPGRAPCRQGRATSAAAGGRARPAGRGAVRRAGGKGGVAAHRRTYIRTYIDSEPTSPGAVRGTWLLPPRRKAAVGRAHEANRARHAHVALEPAPHHGVNGVPFIAGVGIVGTGGTYLDDPVVLEADLAQPAAAAKWVVGAW